MLRARHKGKCRVCLTMVDGWTTDSWAEGKSVPGNASWPMRVSIPVTAQMGMISA